MDTRIGESIRERSRRPIRNKRYTRRGYSEDKRQPKRLFTPEIKKYLKDWLVRRRENPYPNREEKKSLAIQTGLTYIQVCNWFANWRRKLKNAGNEPQRKTWGGLIKSYNSQVHGNVEHFSICSDDSIWEELKPSCNEIYENMQQSSFIKYKTNQADHSYTSYSESKPINNNNNDHQDQCYLISSTTENETNDLNPFTQLTNKYKNHIMEKYLRDCQKPEYKAETNRIDITTAPSSMISKWLESAVNFRPSENNYVHWTFQKKQKKKSRISESPLKSNLNQIHGREELDAAEALTRLANSRNFK